MDTRRLRRIGRGWQGAARARSAAYLRVREQHSRAATTPGVSKPSKRGHSSAGRAPALQAGGRRFDPDWLHQWVVHRLQRTHTRLSGLALRRVCGSLKNWEVASVLDETV